MRISKDEQINQLSLFLKASSFKKKSGTWRRKVADGIHVVNVQGSKWGPEYYLNVGFFLSALGNEEHPTEYRCHIRSRIAAPDREAYLLAKEIEQWFFLNGTVEALLKRKTEGRLPAASSVQAVDWLAQHNHSFKPTR